MGKYLLPFVLDQEKKTVSKAEGYAAMFLAIEENRSKGGFLKGEPEHIRALAYFVLPIWINENFAICGTGVFTEDAQPTDYIINLSTVEWTKRFNAKLTSLKELHSLSEINIDSFQKILQIYIDCGKESSESDSIKSDFQFLLSYRFLNLFFPYFLKSTEVKEQLPVVSKFVGKETMLEEEDYWKNLLNKLRQSKHTLLEFIQSLGSITDQFRNKAVKIRKKHLTLHQDAHNSLLERNEKRKNDLEIDFNKKLAEKEVALTETINALKMSQNSQSQKLKTQKKEIQNELSMMKKTYKDKVKELDNVLKDHKKSGEKTDRMFSKFISDLTKEHQSTISHITKNLVKLEQHLELLEEVHSRTLQLEFPSHPSLVYIPIYVADYRSKKKKPRFQFFLPQIFSEKGEKKLVGPLSPQLDQNFTKKLDVFVKNNPEIMDGIIQSFKDENMLLRTDIRDQVLLGLSDITIRGLVDPSEETSHVNLAIKHFKPVFTSDKTGLFE